MLLLTENRKIDVNCKSKTPISFVDNIIINGLAVFLGLLLCIYIRKYVVENIHTHHCLYAIEICQQNHDMRKMDIKKTYLCLNLYTN